MKQGLSQPAIQRIAHGIASVEPAFNTQAFNKAAILGLESLELKERVNHIIACLHQQLPSFEVLAPKLCQLPKSWDFGNPKDSLRGFAAWPIIDYVATHGLEHPKLAFKVLEALTHLFSAEFAIRPFIERYPEAAFRQLTQWSGSPNEHLRRLASEGCRPRLPWGIQLKTLVTDPAPIFPILEFLKDDDSLYVRKSVANNLNDISKDHPALMLGQCEQWQNNTHKHTTWIIKHACRTLIKAGNEQCLTLLGFGKANIKDTTIQCNSIATTTTPLEFEINMTCLQGQSLVIDYAIDFLRANGSYNRKVFKLKILKATKDQAIHLKKSYSFKPISTRKYYPGKHTVSLQVNGSIMASQDFNLK